MMFLSTEMERYRRVVAQTDKQIGKQTDRTGPWSSDQLWFVVRFGEWFIANGLASSKLQVSDPYASTGKNPEYL